MISVAEKQILPVAIAGKADVIRVRHELEELSEAMHQYKLRKGGKQAALPKLSPQTEELATTLGYNLLHVSDREKLTNLIEKVASAAPTIHISFATTPSPAFMKKLIKWLRTEIHQTLLVQVGLQPSVAAGCVVRTSNKQFDFSLRQYLSSKQDLLIKEVKGENE